VPRYPDDGSVAGEPIQMKILKCASLVPGCRFAAEGETMDEIVYKAVVHAVTVHGVEPTPDLVEQIKAAVCDRCAVPLNA
jgi:predicted small metal-binding protein